MKLSQEKSHRAARSKYLLLALLIPSMLCVSALSFSKSYGIMDLMPAKYIYQDSTKRIAKKLYLKGGDLTEELRESRLKEVILYPLSEYFEEDFFETKFVVYFPAQ